MAELLHTLSQFSIQLLYESDAVNHLVAFHRGPVQQFPRLFWKADDLLRLVQTLGSAVHLLQNHADAVVQGIICLMQAVDIPRQASHVLLQARGGFQATSAAPGGVLEPTFQRLCCQPDSAYAFLRPAEGLLRLVQPGVVLVHVPPQGFDLPSKHARIVLIAAAVAIPLPQRFFGAVSELRLAVLQPPHPVVDLSHFFSQNRNLTHGGTGHGQAFG